MERTDHMFQLVKSDGETCNLPSAKPRELVERAALYECFWAVVRECKCSPQMKQIPPWTWIWDVVTESGETLLVVKQAATPAKLKSELSSFHRRKHKCLTRFW